MPAATVVVSGVAPILEPSTTTSEPLGSEVMVTDDVLRAAALRGLERIHHTSSPLCSTTSRTSSPTSRRVRVTLEGGATAIDSYGSWVRPRAASAECSAIAAAFRRCRPGPHPRPIRIDRGRAAVKGHADASPGRAARPAGSAAKRAPGVVDALEPAGHLRCEHLIGDHHFGTKWLCGRGGWLHDWRDAAHHHSRRRHASIAGRQRGAADDHRRGWRQLVDARGPGPRRGGGRGERGLGQITTSPPGAEVTVDGVPRGISPVQVAGLAPGPHAVTLARAGRLLRRTVTVEAGASVPLAVAMAGTGTGPGWLTVTSPVPALIYTGETWSAARTRRGCS